MMETALIVAAGLSAGSSILAGVEGQKAAKFQASQVRLNSELQKTQAEVEEADRREQLLDVLATQEAMFAARGISINSGTPRNIADVSISNANRQTMQSNSLLKIGLAQNSLQQKQLNKQGRASLIGGFANAASTAATTGLSIYKAGSIPGGA